MNCIRFYLGDTDHRGSTFSQYLNTDDAGWERSHDMVQWFFPLPERSNHFDGAPLLTKDEIDLFARCPDLQEKVMRAMTRYETFLGVGFDTTDFGDILRARPAANFAERAKVWLTPKNHNFKRITRMFRFANLIGMGGYADPVKDFLLSLREGEYANVIDETTAWFWKEALEHHATWPPQMFRPQHKPKPLTCSKCGSENLQINTFTVQCKDCPHGWRFGFA